MKHLLKSFLEPTTIYVMGCWFKGYDSTFGITDDYSTCDCIHIPTENDGKEYTSFRIPNGNKMIETYGGVYILTHTQLALALQEMDESNAGLNQEGFKIENFMGDIYVDVVNGDGLSILKPNPNMNEDLLYEILDGHEDDDGRDIKLIFPEGSLNGVEKKECGEILGIEDYD